MLGSRCLVAIFHPSRRCPDGTLEGHLEGGAPAVLPGPETLDGDLSDHLEAYAKRGAEERSKAG